MAPPWVGGIVLAVAGLGALNATLFLFVSHGLVRADARWLPPVCRMDAATCRSILTTRYARLFGLSNAAYGLVWYAVAAGAGVFVVTGVVPPACLALQLVAGVTVLVSLYLAWALLARLRTPCTLCFAGHAINVALFGLLLAAC